ncbi:MAG: hypothetical protein NTZ69_10715 [Bacteroidia bacterium]|nr:hypothetical protein [Bacteroidia bacterium]
MKKEFCLLLLLISLLGGCKKDQSAQLGVWASKDCELLKTRNSILFFERNKNTISATLIKYENSTKGLICHQIGRVSVIGNKIVSKYINTKLDSLIEESSIGTLTNQQLNIYSNGNKQVLSNIEKIKIVEPYEMLDAEKDNIGLCLCQWRLGTRASYDNDILYFESQTNKHSYVFFIKGDYIYCRAARIRSNNNGTLFSQNIRLMFNPKEQTGQMSPENLKISSKDLIIDNSKFDTTKCYFDSEGIYWSLIRFNKDSIFLNGCGEKYFFTKDKTVLSGITDWFKFNSDYNKP